MDEISLFPSPIKANEVPSIIVSLASFGKLNSINSYFIKGERESLDKFQPFLNYKIEMKQKQNRNLKG